jgi:cytochrome d ubiquinol oxidase subunit I
VEALELARWQFGVTTIYHFLFVPVTIGLALSVAMMQTAWHRTKNPIYLRMTRFWGKLMLISFAVGIVTGIVQEFQFGMNWSGYSRFVGDVFGAPLAMEALAAFFVESTFIAIWIFGWGRIKPSLHLASIWLAAGAATLSAYFILAANSWMQNPVGFRLDEATGRAEMTSIWAVLTNETTLYAFPHTILAAISTAGAILVGVSALLILRKTDVEVFRPSLKIGLVVTLVGVLATMFVGDLMGKQLVKVQPMKMAAAEALYETQDPAPFSLFAVAPFEKQPERNSFNIEVPYLLSFFANGNFDSEVKGINQLQAEAEAEYGPGNYRPIIGITYWTFRLMIGAGVLMFLVSLVGIYLWWRRKLESSTWFLYTSIGAIALPFIANSMGWIFTEMGRQPWIVQGLLLTSQAESTSVGAGTVAASLIVFTVLYGVLGIVAGWLAYRFIHRGAEEAPESAGPAAEADEPDPKLTLSY